MESKRSIESTRPTNRVVNWGEFRAAGFGTLWLAWSDSGVVQAHIGGSASEFASELSARGLVGLAKGPLPEWLERPLRAYVAERDADVTQIPIDPAGTKFQRRVWLALRRIPRGEVRTYASIASDVGSPRAMRAVGAANAANPIPVLVPCHRVVEHGLKLGGYSGGLESKRRLLEHEGVRVDGDRVLPGQLDLL